MAAITLNLIARRSISSNAVLCMKKPIFVGELPPKKPASAFGIFLKETFHKDGIVSDAPSRMKVISQMWRTMGQEDKKAYIEKYYSRKLAYEAVKESYMNSMDESEKKSYEKYLKNLRKYKKQKKLRPENPYPRKLSGFQLYMKEQMAEGVWMSSTDKKLGFIKSSQDWKTMSTEEKMMYNEKAVSFHEERVQAYCEKEDQQHDSES